jgi:hypothetical protein
MTSLKKSSHLASRRNVKSWMFVPCHVKGYLQEFCAVNLVGIRERILETVDVPPVCPPRPTNGRVQAQASGTVRPVVLFCFIVINFRPYQKSLICQPPQSGSFHQAAQIYDLLKSIWFASRQHKWLGRVPSGSAL